MDKLCNCFFIYVFSWLNMGLHKMFFSSLFSSLFFFGLLTIENLQAAFSSCMASFHQPTWLLWRSVHSHTLTGVMQNCKSLAILHSIHWETLEFSSLDCCGDQRYEKLGSLWPDTLLYLPEIKSHPNFILNVQFKLRNLGLLGQFQQMSNQSATLFYFPQNQMLLKRILWFHD